MPSSFSRMPAEVLLGIFSLVKPADIDNLQLTCRRFNNIILENPGELPARAVDLQFTQAPLLGFTVVDHAVRRMEPIKQRMYQLGSFLAGRVTVKSVTVSIDTRLNTFAFAYLASMLKKYKDHFKGASVKIYMHTPMDYPWQVLFEAFSGCSTLCCSFRGSRRPSLRSVLAAGIPLSVCGDLDLQDIGGVPTDSIVEWLTSAEKQDRSLTIDSIDQHVNALISLLVERRGELRQLEKRPHYFEHA